MQRNDSWEMPETEMHHGNGSGEQWQWWMAPELRSVKSSQNHLSGLGEHPPCELNLIRV